MASKSVAASQMHSAILSISSSTSPLVVTAGVPMRTPEVTKGLLGALGTVFLFKVIYTSSQRFCSSLPEISIPRRSTSIKWLSVPPVRNLKALLLKGVRQGLGVLYNLALVSFKLRF